MDRIWLEAPLPALCVQRTAGGVQVEANAAARRWASTADVPAGAFQALGERALASGALAGNVQLGPARAQCVPVALPQCLLLWLQPHERDPGAEEHNAHTQLVADALGVGFWSRDIEARGWSWDAQMYRLHGWPPEAGPPSRQQWLDECVHPGDRNWLEQRVQAADARLEPLLETQFRVVARGGGERWIQSWASRIVIGGRRMSFGMHLDVTERKQAESLREEKQRLEAASREKSAFMARMSHELRTPMNAVLGFTHLIETDPDSPPSARQRERLAHIARAGGELMALIDGLLEIASADAGPPDAAQPAALHVLCVEDNPVNLQLVRELIALRPQVRLRTAVDGLSGVDAALAERPDLLLLDLQLPDIDGLEVMRRLRAVPAMAGCRIVALSADAMPGHIEAALAAGFDDYWTKPIQFDVFLGHIDRMAAERADA